MKLLLVVAVLVAVAASAHALTFKLEARTRQCFAETLVRDTPMSFHFKVTAGGKQDVDCIIKNNKDETIKEWKSVTDGEFTLHGEVHQERTHYDICFSNEMARFTPKWVSWYTHAGISPTAARLDQLDPIEKAITGLTQTMLDLQEEQRILRDVAHEHRDIVEGTSETMMWWSLFESFWLIIMAVLQVYYMKRFLEVKTSI